MDKRKSSRTNDLNYRYELYEFRSVIEYLNGMTNFFWDIDSLKQKRPKDKTEMKAFDRAKKWLLENHCEALL